MGLSRARARARSGVKGAYLMGVQALRPFLGPSRC